jgi:hypothetical protein
VDFSGLWVKDAARSDTREFDQVLLDLHFGA